MGGEREASSLPVKVWKDGDVEEGSGKGGGGWGGGQSVGTDNHRRQPC